MVIDDQLNILPISSHTLTITALPTKSKVKKNSYANRSSNKYGMLYWDKYTVTTVAKLTLVKFIVNR